VDSLKASYNLLLTSAKDSCGIRERKEVSWRVHIRQ